MRRSGRGPRSDRKGLVQRPPGAAGGCRGSARRRRCCACYAAKTWRRSHAETVSRALGVTAATLTTWRDAFLAAGEAALATRPDRGEALDSGRLKAKLGAVTIERDLLHETVAALEAGRPLARRRPRP